jgi:hypothetical protein
MATISQDFEVGTPGHAMTSGDPVDASSTQFDAVTIGGGALFAYTNVQSAHGSQAVAVATDGTAASAHAYYYLTDIGSPSKVWFRMYIYIPSGTWGLGTLTRIGGVYNGSTQGVALFITAARKLQMQDTTTAVMGTSSTTLPLDQWFRIEGYGLSSSSVGKGEVKIFLTKDSASATETLTSTATYNTNSANTQMRYGQSSASSGIPTYYLDDVAASSTGYIGPAGTVSTTVTTDLVSATTTIDIPFITQDIVWSGSRFGLSIPTDTTIASVSVSVRHHESDTTDFESVTGRIYVSGTPKGSATSFTVSTNDVVNTITVTSGITVADIPNLAVRVTSRAVAYGATEYIDDAIFSVFYTSQTNVTATPYNVLATTAITTPSIVTGRTVTPACVNGTIKIPSVGVSVSSAYPAYVGTAGSTGISGSWANLTNAVGSGAGDYASGTG